MGKYLVQPNKKQSISLYKKLNNNKLLILLDVRMLLCDDKIVEHCSVLTAATSISGSFVQLQAIIALH